MLNAHSARALITGGAGFIGCAIGARLAELGMAVTVVDNLHPQVHPRQERPRTLVDQIELVRADVTLRSTWEAILENARFDTIVHLAAETGTGQSLTEASRHAQVNVVGTTEMLDALLRRGAVPAHIVLTSSRAVYGEGEWLTSGGEVFSPGVRTHDDLAAGRWDPSLRGAYSKSAIPSRADRTVPRPTSVYGATKLAQEHILTAWTAATGSDLTILRLQNVYGPGQSTTNSYTGIVTLFAQIAAAGGRIELYEDGRIVRDFVYVDDVAEALATCVCVPSRARGTFDIGSGTSTTICELATRIAERFDAPDPYVSGRFRDGDVRAASTDIAEARARFGFRPRWSLDRGLDALLAWMENEQPVDAHSH
jgi:dTDP-L-rhamnose 4-epimerase